MHKVRFKFMVFFSWCVTEVSIVRPHFRNCAFTASLIILHQIYRKIWENFMTAKGLSRYKDDKLVKNTHNR